MEAFIIGGGPSLKGFDFNCLKDKFCIASNYAIFDIPWAQYFITIDATFTRKVISRIDEFHNHKAHKVFVANFASGYLVDRADAIVDSRYEMVYDLSPYNQIVRSYEYSGFADNYDDFKNGNNSGYCALQLAIILGYTKIYLLGIDLACHDDRSHYHDGYKSQMRQLESFHKYYVDGLTELQVERPEIKVISCSPISRLNNIIEYRPFSSI